MPHVEYTGIDGERWPSATQLTRLLPQDWVWGWYSREVQKAGWKGWQKCKKKSEAGMKLGTAVHELLDMWAGPEAPPVAPDKKVLALAVPLWAAATGRAEEVLYGDVHLVSVAEKIHGSADLIVKLTDGITYIGDYKTSFVKDDLAHPIQLGVYALGWNEEHPDRPIDDGFIARIDKKTRKVAIDMYNGLHHYYPIIRSLRDIWQYVNHTGPWGK